MNRFKYINRQTKLIIGGASAIGVTAGISCAYISLMVSK